MSVNYISLLTHFIFLAMCTYYHHNYLTTHYTSFIQQLQKLVVAQQKCLHHHLFFCYWREQARERERTWINLINFSFLLFTSLSLWQLQLPYCNSAEWGSYIKIFHVMMFNEIGNEWKYWHFDDIAITFLYYLDLILTNCWWKKFY